MYKIEHPITTFDRGVERLKLLSIILSKNASKCFLSNNLEGIKMKIFD